MKHVIEKIDRALKALYALDVPYHAEEFLLDREISAQARIGNSNFQGAVLLKSQGPEDVEIGIYFSEAVKKELETYECWENQTWSTSQLNAFSVAAKEVSYFQCIAYHLDQGRPVSHLELELQGEIDKFLLSFFTHRYRDSGETAFEILFEKHFDRYSLLATLSRDRKTRYEEAIQLARRFLMKHRKNLQDTSKHEQVLRILRRFYRLNGSDKLSAIGN